jgi:hypothetical protein
MNLDNSDDTFDMNFLISMVESSGNTEVIEERCPLEVSIYGMRSRRSGWDTFKNL